MKKCKEIWDGLKYSGYVLSHPIRGFYEMRFEGKGNLWSCLILLVLMILAMVSNQLYVGTIFSSVNMREFNIIHQIAAVLIPVLLWCVANWSVTTLMDGEGSFKDIYIATAYALVPQVLVDIPMLLLSQVLVREEGRIYQALAMLGIVWTGLLLFTGLMTIHQHSFFKTLTTVLIAVVAMAAILFLVLLFFALIQQLVNFLYVFYKEIDLRF